MGFHKGVGLRTEGLFLLVDSYYYLSASMTGFKIGEGGRGLVYLVSLIDDRDHLSVPHEIGEHSQIGNVHVSEESHELLAHKSGFQIGSELDQQPSRAFVVPSRSSNPDHDAYAVRVEDSPALGERMVPHDVEDQVVALIGLREIFFGVIDHPVCAD